MSSDHKRPLYAFAVVALVCAFFVGSGLRSEAFTSLLRSVHGPEQVAAGVVVIEGVPLGNTGLGGSGRAAEGATSGPADAAPRADVFGGQPHATPTTHAAPTTGAAPSVGQRAVRSQEPGSSAQERRGVAGLASGPDLGVRHEGGSARALRSQATDAATSGTPARRHSEHGKRGHHRSGEAGHDQRHVKGKRHAKSDRHAKGKSHVKGKKKRSRR